MELFGKHTIVIAVICVLFSQGNLDRSKETA